MEFNHVYKLHHMLSGRRTPLPLDTILNSLEIQKATFQRIRAFMVDSLSAPIANKKGEGYYYKNPDKHDQSYELPGLWFTPQELTALALFGRLLEASQPALLPQLLKPVQSKLSELMAKQGISEQICQQRLRILPQWQRRYDPSIFTRIAQALLQRKRLQISYQKRQATSHKLRTISPQRLIYYRDNWYLDAWCHFRTALRTFALDRVERVHTHDTQAMDISEEQLDDHFSSSYGIFSGSPRFIAELEFTPNIAPWVSGEQWHPEQSEEWAENGHYRLKIPYNNPTELIGDILRYGADVKVLAPEELGQAVKQQLEDALKKYT